MKTIAILFSALWLLVLLSACSDGEPPLARVKGTVTLNGEPVAGKHVQFEPIAGTGGLGAAANTDANGNYDLIAIRGGTLVDLFGVLPGKYKVTISEPVFHIDTELTVQGESSEADVAIGPPSHTSKRKPPKMVIPEIYTSLETTPFEIEVPLEGARIELKLDGNSQFRNS